MDFSPPNTLVNHASYVIEKIFYLLGQDEDMHMNISVYYNKTHFRTVN